MTRWISLFLLVGCAQSDGDGKKNKGSDTPDDTVELPSPYIAPEESAPEPTATAQEIEDALLAGIDAALEVSPGPVKSAWEAAMATADGGCPYYFSSPDGDYWFDDCTSSQNSHFSGYAFGMDAVDQYDPTYGISFDIWYVGGAATIDTEASGTMVLGGTAYTVHYEEPISGTQTWQAIVQGTFLWDGPEADGTWLERGYDPDLVQTYVYLPATTGHAFGLDGGIGGLGANGQWAVAFDQVNHIGILLGSPCSLEPHGTISVRASDGSWYDVRFHGPHPETFETSGECDGCGDVFFHGEAIGEICADFDSWLGWGASPW